MNFKDWLKEKIWAINRFGGFKPLSISSVKYFPYKEDSKNYRIATQLPKVEKCSQGIPIPPKDLWIGYSDNVEGYLGSGESDCKTMIEGLGETGFAFNDGQRILEFGCAAGRMLRHLYRYAQKSDVWGIDISGNHIMWNKRYFPSCFKFAVTTTIPHLPFEDNHFDLIYSGSVFTHIDDLADAWLLELRRIIKPGGRIFITIHDEHSLKLLKKDYPDAALTKTIIDNEALTTDFDLCVFDRDAHSQVFYRREYYLDILKSVMKVIWIKPEAYGYQTGIILEK